MFPNLNPPTDNIYKFFCILGLILFISSFASIFYVSETSFNKEVKYIIDMQPIKYKTEHNIPLTINETFKLENSQDLLSITKSETKIKIIVISIFSGFCLALFFWSLKIWYSKIQYRDDAIADFQKQKIEKELEKLNLEIQILKSQLLTINQSTANNASNSNDAV